MTRVGLIAGEHSGDTLAAALVQDLLRLNPTWHISGIAGPRAAAAGCEVVISLDQLNVMGFIDPIKKLPHLLHVRHKILKYFQQQKIDLFIGIDYPDFNLNIAQSLKSKGVTTVHYVSPSVWAWRRSRIKQIAQSIDLMMTLFPFEVSIYQQHHIPVLFAGHPLADQIPLVCSTSCAQKSLQLPKARVITVLAGSRDRELHHLLPVYLLALMKLQRHQAIVVLFPVVSEKHANKIRSLCHKFQVSFPYKILVNQTRTAIAAADIACVTSGTATLEVMLHKKPMVVCYRLPWLSYQIAKRLVQVPYISLPNLIINDMVVPELIQTEANPETLMNHLQQLLNPETAAAQIAHFTAWHPRLQQQAAQTAAQAVTNLC